MLATKLFTYPLIVLQIAILCCATIPPESVTLSQEVGKGIAENQRAYLGLLNRYFEIKRQLINDAILNEYLPNYIKSIQEGLKQADEDPNKFTSKMLKDILTDIVKKRDELHEDLEKTRVAIWERINEDHTLLLEANSTITGLLQSAVSVRAEASSLGKTIQEATKTKFNFEDFEKLFDEHLKKIGDTSAELINLHDSIEALFKNEGKNNE